MEVINVVIAALFTLVILYFIAQLFLKPIKLLWKVVFNSAVGLIILLLINVVGASFSFMIPVNLITVLIAGFPGLPEELLSYKHSYDLPHDRLRASHAWSLWAGLQLRFLTNPTSDPAGARQL
jgi:inhibitor of the pro-sigma K processing machinery